MSEGFYLHQPRHSSDRGPQCSSTRTEGFADALVVATPSLAAALSLAAIAFVLGYPQSVSRWYVVGESVELLAAVLGGHVARSVGSNATGNVHGILEGYR